MTTNGTVVKDIPKVTLSVYEAVADNGFDNVVQEAAVVHKFTGPTSTSKSLEDVGAKLFIAAK